MDHLAAIFTEVVYHVRRTRVHRREAQLARAGASHLGWQISGRRYADLVAQPRDRTDAPSSSCPVAYAKRRTRAIVHS